MSTQLGVFGLGTMGANLARNAARNGAEVVVFNRTTEKTKEFMKNHGSEGAFVESDTLESFVKNLKAPRAILLMVKAGAPTDEVIDELVPLLTKGDMLIDGGNSHYKDTERREKMLTDKGLHFIGMGVSGGEEGALNGPSMMPGGKKEGFEMLSPLLMQMAADDGKGGKCVSYIGAGGSGHFVKMVHNGIEYGLMQMIAETYQILRELGELSNAELHETFDTWNKSPYLKSFLIEITAKIFLKKDEETGKDLVDLILDKAGQKGTGKWTTETAMNLGVATPIITAAVDARIISGTKDFRMERSKEAPFVATDAKITDKKQLIDLARAGLEFGFCNAFAEGFLLLSVANTEYKWNLNFGDIARIWQGGCIIRSGIVERFGAMFTGDKAAQMELRDVFGTQNQKAIREYLLLGPSKGIPTPSLLASLTSYDSYRTARLPQNLIQAQRDFFGAHTFERTDKPGSFHAQW